MSPSTPSMSNPISSNTTSSNVTSSNVTSSNVTSSNVTSSNVTSTQCVIVGQSIDAITTATVMVSLGHCVHLYADSDELQRTLKNYSFEHQLQALWQLYLSQDSIKVQQVPQDASTLFAACHDETVSSSSHPVLYWMFYRDLPESWLEKVGNEQHWVNQLNESSVSSQIPVVMSGISTLGVFSEIAQHCQRPWVYYVPFVFLQDGRTYPSMLSPKLWLMGEKTPDSVNKVPMLQPLIAQAQQSYISDIATIEFSRNAIMSMLATRVSFMNELSRLADEQGVDILEVAQIMGKDARIGKSYLKAGWGFGGKSLPTEITALQDTLANSQVEHRLMQAVYTINDDQKELIFRKFWQYFDGAIENKQVSIWGASYKAGSGRTTESAIHPLLRLLWSYNITTYVYASEAETELTDLYADQPLLKFTSSPTEQLIHSDAVFVLSWESTQRLPISAINEVVIPIFDAQNAFSRPQIQTLKGDYQGIGRRK